jgi:hypothetical protein
MREGPVGESCQGKRSFPSWSRLERRYGMKRGNFWFGLGLAVLCLCGAILALSCGGGGGGSSTGTVNTSISDPPTCKTTFPNVWVTITRVRAHTSSSNAGENDSGWIDLLDLRDDPKQIDLMNLSQTDCLLTQLGSKSGIPAGQYQQIRLYLLSNNPPESTAKPDPNNCGVVNGFNCVVTSDYATHILELSSEAQTGIKIPSGQIAGGRFVVPAGEVVDLNIDFDACSSIVQQGSGQFRLKPVLHAAKISLTNPVKISGTVVDNESGDPISGAILFLEKPDADGIDRMIMQTLSKSDGTFVFCPVPSGYFDVVADALVDDTAYNATITFSVPSGTDMGNIPIIPETGASTLPAEISGQITTTTGSAATQADISLSALQLADDTWVTIPPLGSSTPNVVTQAGFCPENTDCTGYILYVPASNPSVGTFAVNQSTNYSVPAGPPINYRVNARAFTIATPANPVSEPNCSSSSLEEPVQVEAGVRYNDVDFGFTDCR